MLSRLEAFYVAADERSRNNGKEMVIVKVFGAFRNASDFVTRTTHHLCGPVTTRLAAQRRRGRRRATVLRSPCQPRRIEAHQVAGEQSTGLASTANRQWVLVAPPCGIGNPATAARPASACMALRQHCKRRSSRDACASVSRAARRPGGVAAQRTAGRAWRALYSGDGRRPRRCAGSRAAARLPCVVRAARCLGTARCRPAGAVARAGRAVPCGPSPRPAAHGARGTDGLCAVRICIHLYRAWRCMPAGARGVYGTAHVACDQLPQRACMTAKVVGVKLQHPASAAGEVGPTSGYPGRGLEKAAHFLLPALIWLPIIRIGGYSRGDFLRR